jgi:acetyl esterase/lipase
MPDPSDFDPPEFEDGPGSETAQGPEGMDVVRALLAQRAPETADWATRRQQMDAFVALAPLAEGWRTDEVDLGRPAERHSGPQTHPNRAILYLHGGGFCIGSPVSHRGLISQIAAAAKAEAFALDYRLAPEHPFPAGLDDAVEAYRRLLAMGLPPGGLAIAGDSAGGGLALALFHRLKAEGLPAPGALILISPWLDLTLTAPSYEEREDLDPMVSKASLQAYADAYIAGQDPKHPGISPLFADHSGLPPTLIHVGTDEVLFSDSETFARAALALDADVQLEIWPAMIHVWHIFYPLMPDARQAIAWAGEWLIRRWNRVQP